MANRRAATYDSPDRNDGAVTIALERISPVWVAGVAIFALGLAIRWPTAIGVAPLTSVEATRAMEAYDVIRGRAVDGAASPLLLYLQALLMFAFTASDAGARLAPWLFGVAAPALPWLFARQTGPIAAGLTSFLLAISPSLGYFARYVGASEMALVGCLVVLALVFLDRDLPLPRPVAAGVALGFTVTTGPFGWLGLALISISLAVAPGGGRLGFGGARFGVLADRRTWLVALPTIVLVSTGLLSRLGGISEVVADAPTMVVEKLLRGAAPAGWNTLPAVLVTYETLALALALWGLVTVTGAPRDAVMSETGQESWLVTPFESFVTTWTIVSLAVLSVGFRAELEAAPLLVAPVAFLAGLAAANEAPRLGDQIGNPLVMIATAGLIALTLLTGMALNHLTNPAMPTWLPGAVIVLPPLLVLLFVSLVWVWTSREVAVTAVVFATVAVLALGGVRASWTVNLTDADNPSELLITEAMTEDAWNLPFDLWTRYAVMQARGGRPSVAVAIAPELRPLLEWQFREFENVKFENPVTSTARILVSTQLLPDLGLRARTYTLTWAELPTSESVNPWFRFWRWLAMREPGGGAQGIVVHLYDRR